MKPPRLARAWKFALAAALVAGAGLAAWLYFEAGSDGPQFRTVQVERGPITATVSATGTLNPVTSVQVGTQVSGQIKELYVDFNSPVRRGQLIARIDPETFEYRVRQAQADAEAARSALGRVQVSLINAQRELARSRELLAQGFISAARLDEAQRQAEIALAQRDVAAVQAAAQRAGGAEALAALTQLEAAQAALQAAQARLAQTVLRAPAAGRVVGRTVEPGQVVAPTRALLVLAPDGPTELLAAVDERFIAQLQPGQRAQVLADAHPQQPFAARITRIAPAVDAQRGAVEVRLVPEGQAPPFLREDMTLSVEIVTAERAAARVLPLGALRAAPVGERAQVLVVREGRAELRTLDLGLRTLDRVEVTAGLAEGDRVLLDPLLQPGQRVRVRVVDAAQAAAAAGTRGAGGEGSGAAMGAGAAR